MRGPKETFKHDLKRVVVMSALGLLLGSIGGLSVSRAKSKSAKPRPSVTPAPTASPRPSPSPTPVPVPPKLSVRKDQPSSDLPFWRRNEAVAKKIRDERAVVVSVKQEDVKNNPELMRFVMSGAGHVSRSKDFCFRLGQQYHRLQKISDHFKTVNYDARRSHLFLITEALGYQARMLLKVTPVAEDWRSELQWEVIWGHFKGMKGVMGFEQVPGSRDAKTEMSIQALYEAKELPVPKILLGFALEVVTQKVAEKIRTYIEAQPSSALDEPQPAPPALQFLELKPFPSGTPHFEGPPLAPIKDKKKESRP